MLHTMAQGLWPFGSGEEVFGRVFTIYGCGGHLGHVTQMPQTNFHSPDPWRLHMKFGFDWPSSFGEEDLWKWWTDHDDGACLYYKLTNEPKGSGKLKCNIHINYFGKIKCNADGPYLVFSELKPETHIYIYLFGLMVHVTASTLMTAQTPSLVSVTYFPCYRKFPRSDCSCRPWSE